jgi:hypothetical protein
MSAERPSVILKVRERPGGSGGHVHLDLFVGQREGSLALAGRLTFNLVEWLSIRALLRRGADAAHSTITLVFEGENADHA